MIPIPTAIAIAAFTAVITSLLWSIRVMSLLSECDSLKAQSDRWEDSYLDCISQLNFKKDDCYKLIETNQHLRHQIIRIKHHLRTRGPILP